MTDAGEPASTYDEALRALAERGRFGIRLGLGRTRALLRELGHPERPVRGALVAGTNGKGSVLALADCGAARRRLPRRHDAQAAPRHLSRADLHRRPADRRRRLRPARRARPRVADRVARRHGEPTEFELLTAVVFARFAEVRPGRRARRGRAWRAARRDACLGRRSRRRDQRRPRPHGPAREHDHRRSPARRRRSSSEATWPSPARAVTAWRSSAGARDASACR